MNEPIGEIRIELHEGGNVVLRARGDWPLASMALAEKIMSNQVTQRLLEQQSRIVQPTRPVIPESG